MVDPMVGLPTARLARTLDRSSATRYRLDRGHISHRTMSTLSASVGRKATNKKADVLLTQRLLNGAQHFLIPYAPLPEDGIPSTILDSVIEAFQERVVQGVKPDGRVNPNGSTWVKLLQVSTFFPRPPHVQAFLDMAGPAAQKVQSTWKVPTSVLLAQAAVESGWGRHVIGNAYFGIKGTTGTAGGVAFGTTEVIGGKTIKMTDTFRSYRNFEESADDYGRFLSGNARYSAAFTFATNPDRFVDEVAKAGYATDPNYAATVKSIIKSFRLTDYDK